MDGHINDIIKAQCATARATLSALVLDKTIAHCTKSEDLSLNNTSLYVLKYGQMPANTRQLDLHFDEANLHFVLRNEKEILPGGIVTLPLNFVTTSQVVPDISSTLDPSIAISPDLLFAPQLCINSISLANCSDTKIVIAQDSVDSSP